MALNQADLVKPEGERELIEGKVARTLFAADDTGYKVVQINHRHSLVTVVGQMPDYRDGDRVALWAVPVEHPRFGTQYRVTGIAEVEFKREVDLVEFLSSSVFRDIGPKVAKAVVDYFGLGARKILDDNPERLSEVPGVGPVRKRRMQEAWIENRILFKTLEELTGMGLSHAAGMKAWGQYNHRAPQVIREDPYVLITLDGVGFVECDRIALASGMDPRSPKRLSAACLYILDRALKSGGHCYLPTEMLVNEVESLIRLEVSSSDCMAAVMVSRGRAVVVNPAFSALARVKEAEAAVAERIRSLARPSPLYGSHDEMLADARRRGLIHGIELADEQVAAIYNALSYGVSVITGGPGTGKTTILGIVCNLLAAHEIDVTLCAPTGRAAKRLSESTGRDARTIHRTIGLGPGGMAEYDEEYPLPTGAVVVDETSMLDIILADQLLRAVPAGCRLVLIGDKDQLPSVGPGYVLHDIIESRAVPVTRLTQVFRQDSDSSIVSVAHAILRGEEPHLPDYSGFVDGGCAIITAETEEDAKSTMERLMAEELTVAGFDRDSVKLLSPMKKRELGTGVMNGILQSRMNRAVALHYMSLEHAKVKFYEGDIVMQTRNNYQKDCFNGDIGVVAEVDYPRRCLYVEYPDRRDRVKYDRSELDELILAYACTVHKSQGSEYPVVVLVMHQSQSVMLKRKILYTGLTRARRMCIIVGTRKAVRQAVMHDEESRRFTMLGEHLKEG